MHLDESFFGPKFSFSKAKWDNYVSSENTANYDAHAALFFFQFQNICKSNGYWYLFIYLLQLILYYIVLQNEKAFLGHGAG